MSLNFKQAPDLLFIMGFMLFGILLVLLFYRAWKYKKIKPIVLIRAGFLALILFSFLSPRITRRIIDTENLPWVLYIDNSMSIGYHQDHSLRTVNTGIVSFRNELESRKIPYRDFVFSDSVYPASGSREIDGSGQMTDFGNVLQHIIDTQENLGGAVIVSDGQITQGAGPSSLVGDITIPVHTAGIGSETPLVDVAINSIDVPTAAVKGEEVEALILVSSTGASRERLNVSLYRENKMIGSRFVTVYGGESISEVRFRFKPENLGSVHYRVQVSSLSDEINILNNRQSFNIMVLKDEYKVALLTGVPSFNTQVIKSLVSNQRRVNFQHFLSDGDQDNSRMGAFWKTPFELIILDNFPAKNLPVRWQKLFARKILAQNTSLLWIVGPNQTAETAASIFPFFHVQSPAQILEKEERYNWYFNESEIENMLPGFSRNSPDYASVEFPPVRTGIELESTHSDYTVLANISTGNVSVPMLTLGEKESFRYGILATSDLSTLYYRLKNTRNHALLPDLMAVIARWLMRSEGEKDIYFSLNKSNYQRGEQVLIYGNRTADTSPYTTGTVSVIHEGNVIQTTRLRYNTGKDRWEGQFWASAPGQYSYEVKIESNGSTSLQKGNFSVEESQIELNRVTLNKDLLTQISATTGGSFVSWASRAEILDDINLLEKTELYHREIDLLENKLWLVLLILLFTIELAWRRYIGLT